MIRGSLISATVRHFISVVQAQFESVSGEAIESHLKLLVPTIARLPWRVFRSLPHLPSIPHLQPTNLGLFAAPVNRRRGARFQWSGIPGAVHPYGWAIGRVHGFEGRGSHRCLFLGSQSFPCLTRLRSEELTIDRTRGSPDRHTGSRIGTMRVWVRGQMGKSQ